MAKKIKRILVLNRGEIACRIIQAIQEIGLQACAVFSEADRNTRATKLADEAYFIGEAAPKHSYLNISKLVALAQENQIDAVHPGYGFLSERSEACTAFSQAGISWIGPQAESISLLGNKMRAKELLEQHNLATLPWAKVSLQDKQELQKHANQIGYPLLLKAAAGGGGKGMRLVTQEKDLIASAQAAGNEAEAAFGDGTLLVEKYLVHPRHVEVQVLGDDQGNIWHFGERDCSYQRRHQKVIEEAPAPNLSDDTREKLGRTAVAIAKLAHYQSAGTVEFLLDAAENFYFLEMNSRLQVEHSVTEAVWGIDLVNAQIRIAQGDSLPDIFPEKPGPRGHAIEARVYAEDPAHQYAPSPGTIGKLSFPFGTGVRIDTGVEEGSEISLNYDSMIAKITANASSRDLAIDRLVWALRNTTIYGVVSNINFLQDLLTNKDFRKFSIHVKYLDTFAWKDEIPIEVLQDKEKIVAEATSGSTNYSTGYSFGTNQVPSPWDNVKTGARS